MVIFLDKFLKESLFFCIKMFKFLKEKLKKGLDLFSKKVEEDVVSEEVVEEKVEEVKVEEKKVVEEFKDRIPTAYELAQRKKKKEVEEKKEEVIEELEPEPEVEVEEKKPSAAELLKQVDEKPQVKIPTAAEILDQAVEEKEKLEKRIPTAREVVEKLREEKKEPEKKGFFGKLKDKIVTKKIDEKQFEELFWNLELILLENNVAVEVIEKIKSDLKEELVDKPIQRGKVLDRISGVLKNSVEGLFDVEQFDLLERVKVKSPFIICFVGINGSGKTTTIAKIAQLLMDNDLKCVMAAADTFRAASIEQLEEHANNLGVKVIKHDYGSDAAAVAFDAVRYAESKGTDVVLVDTAGRLQSNVNLMDELKKVIRVVKPDLTLFVGESITGNDCVNQAREFNEIVGIDGIILSKADIDEKGGAAISVSYVTKKPILFIGTGQEYKDLKEFNSDVVVESLGLES